VAHLIQRLRGPAATIAACFLIAHFTLWPQYGAPHPYFDPCVICGSYGSSNLLLNALLFIPLGIALRVSGRTLAFTLVFSIAATTLVEMVQLFAIPGRSAALGDILANATGGVIGWLLAASSSTLFRPTVKQASILSWLQATAIIMLSALGGWLFYAAPTPDPYFGQVAPVIRERGAVDGVVTNATLNGETLEDGRLSPSQTVATRDALRRNELSLSAALALRNVKQRMALALRIADAREEEVAVLALERTDAVFAVRTRAVGVGLFHPMLRLSNAFNCDSCPGGIDREQKHVTGERRRSHYQLSVTGKEGTRSVSMSVSPNMTWLAFLPQMGAGNGVVEGTFVWLLMQYLVLAYWAAYTSRGLRSVLIAFASAFIVGTVTQFVLPPFMGMSRGSSSDSMALLLGTAAGILLALISIALQRLPAHDQLT
jgi:hypothetical protein